VFQNRLLRGVFGTKGEDVVGSWNKFSFAGIQLIIFFFTGFTAPVGPGLFSVS
jgi:hypothetical protein